MKNVKEIVETMISFDIFFQEKKFKKSKSIFSYILFVYLFFGCMLILPDDYRFFVLPGKYASNIYCIILQLVRMHQKINIPVHHCLFFPYVCYILFILEYLTKSNN